MALTRGAKTSPGVAVMVAGANARRLFRKQNNVSSAPSLPGSKEQSQLSGLHDNPGSYSVWRLLFCIVHCGDPGDSGGGSAGDSLETD